MRFGLDNSLHHRAFDEIDMHNCLQGASRIVGFANSPHQNLESVSVGGSGVLHKRVDHPTMFRNDIEFLGLEGLGPFRHEGDAGIDDGYCR